MEQSCQHTSDRGLSRGSGDSTEKCLGPEQTRTLKFEEEQNGEGKEEGLVLRGTYQAGSRRVSRSSSLTGFPDPGDVL